MNLDLMKFDTEKVAIFVPERLKQTRPGQAPVAYGFNVMQCH